MWCYICPQDAVRVSVIRPCKSVYKLGVLRGRCKSVHKTIASRWHSSETSLPRYKLTLQSQCTPQSQCHWEPCLLPWCMLLTSHSYSGNSVYFHGYAKFFKKTGLYKLLMMSRTAANTSWPGTTLRLEPLFLYTCIESRGWEDENRVGWWWGVLVIGVEDRWYGVG